MGAPTAIPPHGQEIRGFSRGIWSQVILFPPELDNCVNLLFLTGYCSPVRWSMALLVGNSDAAHVALGSPVGASLHSSATVPSMAILLFTT